MNTSVIIQARMGSTRLPGKVLMDLGGKPVLWHMVERARHVRGVNTVVVATSVESEDDAIEQFCKENHIPVVRGSKDDVLSRYYDALQAFPSDIIVRLTSDCPLIDPVTVAQCIDASMQGGYDYVSNVVPGERTYPRGLDVEVVKASALERAHREAKDPYFREHVMPYIWKNVPGDFTIGPMVTAPPELARTHYRLTLDYPEDYKLLSLLYNELYKGGVINARDAVKYLDAHPDLAEINYFREGDHVSLIKQNDSHR